MAGGLARSHVRAFVYRRVVRSRKVLWYSKRGNVATRHFFFGDGGHDPFNISRIADGIPGVSKLS